MPTIKYKTKVKVIVEPNGTESKCIDFKRQVTRSDCDLKPHQHTYYNSALFPAMLQRAYQTAIGGKEWARLADLPSAVSVDTSKFLAVVTVQLPDNFR